MHGHLAVITGADTICNPSYIQNITHLSYIDRLKYLNLPTLLYRKFRGYMIMVFKLLNGIYDSNIACHLVKPNNFVTRGNCLRLYKRHSHYDLRKYIFLDIALYQVEIVCLILLLLLAQLVYVRKDLINFGEIEHVFLIIQPT